MKQPKYIRIYDNKGESFDRFTIVFGRKTFSGEFIYLGLSEYPYHPMGFGHHGTSKEPIDRPTYSHLGKKIKWNDLNEDCKKAVNESYKSVWNITDENKKENLFVN
jgi:hypothetical protein